MARPTNKERVRRLLRKCGDMPLTDVREVLGSGADSAILDLIEEHEVRLGWPVTHLTLCEG